MNAPAAPAARSPRGGAPGFDAPRGGGSRHARILAARLRASTLQGLQYRLDFVLEGLTSILWLGVTLVPLWVVFEDRPAVAGWTFPESLVVLGFFLVLKALLEGAIFPSLVAVVEHVRRGTLDFVLLKPADGQFLVSTERFVPWRAVEGIGGIALIAGALAAMQKSPSPGQVVAALAILLAGASVLYALWISIVSLAFFVVKVDNLGYLFTSIYGAARWPIHVYHGAARVVFTFVLPLAVMTSFPAMALLGTLGPAQAAGSAVAAILSLALSRILWRGAIRRYTSAGG